MMAYMPDTYVELKALIESLHPDAFKDANNSSITY